MSEIRADVAPQQRLFNLRMVNLVLATRGAGWQLALADAVAAGALPALDDIVRGADAEEAELAREIRSRLGAELADGPLSAPQTVDPGAPLSLRPSDYEGWLALQTRTGVEYRISTTDCAVLSGLAMRDERQTVIAGGTFVGSGFAFVNPSSTAHVRIRTAHCQNPGRVTISAGAPSQEIFSSASEEYPQAIGVGTRYVGKLTGESQWVSLAATAGQTLVVDVTPRTDALDTLLTVINRKSGDTIAEDDDGGFGWGSHLEFTASENGDVLMEVRRLNEERGEYELTVTEMVPQDIVAGETYGGDLTTGTVQWWRFRPVPGTIYRAEVRPSTDSLDTVLTVLDRDGKAVLAEDDDGGVAFGSRLSFARTTDQPVLLRIRRLDESTGLYTLTVDEQELRFEHAEPAIRPGDYRGTLSEEREQWWRLDTPPGRYRIRTLPEGDLDTEIALYDSEALTRLAQNDDTDGDLSSEILFQTGEETTHVLSVRSNAGTDAYTLQFEQLPALIDLATPATKGRTYSVSLPKDGELWWSLQTEAGARYELEARPIDQIDTVMTLFASDGVTEIDYNDDGGLNGGSRLVYEVEDEELVFINVSGFAGSEGEFELHVR